MAGLSRLLDRRHLMLEEAHYLKWMGLEKDARRMLYSLCRVLERHHGKDYDEDRFYGRSDGERAVTGGNNVVEKLEGTEESEEARAYAAATANHGK